MPKNKLNINDYLPEIKERYERDLLERVAGILIARGFALETDADIAHMFKERIKKTVIDGITTLNIDGVEFCAYGPVIASIEGEEIKTNYKFAEI